VNLVFCVYPNPFKNFPFQYLSCEEIQMKQGLWLVVLCWVCFSAAELLAVESIHLGPRPFFLVEDMDEGPLKEQLIQCSGKPVRKRNFSIGHRGAALQFPEHTRESYLAAARMGAGILECDVTFTKDRQLVCRHSQVDLHTTTDILAHPDLAAKCTVPFEPGDLASGKKAKVECRTSDLTLAEFRRLQGKMDAANPFAATPEEYMKGTANWRTDLYATRGTLMTHAESIELFMELGVKFTPELKSAKEEMPYEGEFSQKDYAQKLIEEYKVAGVEPSEVYPQSFNLDDVLYWIEREPEFGKQALYLDGRTYRPSFRSSLEDMQELSDRGVRILAPPVYALLDVDGEEIVPSAYARQARQAGLDLITWTLERSGPLAGGGGWYYQTVKEMINNDGDVMQVLDVLAKEVGVLGVFSDWPATTTYYANCMDLP
jgi:glycerophosphoryl diester phosphodiesterase